MVTSQMDDAATFAVFQVPDPHNTALGLWLQLSPLGVC